MTAKSCFEVGLFLAGTIWGDKLSEPELYYTVKEKAESALVTIGLNRQLPEPPAFTNINERLQWIADKMENTKQQIKNSIDDSYGKMGGYCYQVGIALDKL